jgi:hypothetical protein
MHDKQYIKVSPRGGGHIALRLRLHKKMRLLALPAPQQCTLKERILCLTLNILKNFFIAGRSSEEQEAQRRHFKCIILF